MKLNKNLTTEELDLFQKDTTLDEKISTLICDALTDSFGFKAWCKMKFDEIKPLLCDIEIDIYKEPYLCIYSKYSDRLSLYIREDKVHICAWYDTAKDVIIDENYLKNRKVPVFIRNIINELIKFNIVINYESMKEIKLPKWIRFINNDNETVFSHLTKAGDVIYVNGLCQEDGKVIIYRGNDVIKEVDTVEELIMPGDLIEVTGHRDSIEFVVNDVALPEISLIGSGHSLDVYLDDDMKITKISTRNSEDGFTKQWEVSK